MSLPQESGSAGESGRYRAVLKSTSLIGGASAVNILVGMVRTKFVAILLGPAGVGLAGVYGQIVALASMISGLGIASSGVRQVAEAAGTGDERHVARTVVTLRRAAWATGALGMLALAAASLPVSRATFGDDDHAWPIALLGIAVLLGGVSSAQASLLRGVRRIADVARVTVLGAVGGTAVSIPCYYAFGLRGVVAALVLASLAGAAPSWWYARRLPLAPVRLGWGESARQARGLVALGASFMVAGVLSAATTYFVQALLTRTFGLAGAGMYQAAYSLSGALIGFVLGAMAADYYPRLAAVSSDDAAVLRAVNEQAQVAVLLALPGLLAMTVFAPVVVRLFYAAEFAAAIPILRWLVLGLLGRVVSWPLGYVLLARGSGRLYLAAEATACAVQAASVAVLTRAFGLAGAGVAFVLTYVAYTALLLLVLRRTAGGSWNARTRRLNAAAAAVLVAVTANAALNPEPISRWGLGVVLAAATGWFCLAELMRYSGVSVVQALSRLRGAR